MREISAGVIIYKKTKDGPRFLILYHGGDYWNFAKGRLEKDEKSFKAALREVGEETGISARNLRFREWFKVYDRFVFTRVGERVSKLVIFYLAESLTSRVIISDEHHGYGWFLYRDAHRLLKYENLRNLLKMVNDTIHGKNPVRQNRYIPKEERKD